MPPSTRFHLRAVLDEVPLSVLPAVATELEEDDGARGEVRDGVSRGDLHTSPRRYLASGDRTGRNARPRCLQQCEDSVEAQGRGVRVGGRGDLLCRMQETALRHAEGCQRAWQLKALRQFSPIRQYAKVIQIGGRDVRYPRRIGSTAAPDVSRLKVDPPPAVKAVETWT